VFAAVTRSPGNIVVDDIPEPGHPRAGRVVVRPETVGICGSDLHLFSGHTAAFSGARDFFPRIQGHETSAVIDELGAQAPPHLKPGMRVAVMPQTRCGHCYPCRTGRSNVCVQLRLVGVHPDGGLQERLDVKANAAFPAGDLDAGCTAFAEPMSIAVHALRRAGPTAWAGKGRERGDLTRRPTAEEALALATEVVSHAGRVVMVGMSSGTASVRPGIFREKEIEVVGSSTACPPDFGEAVRLVAENRAKVSKVLTHRFPRGRVPDAFRFAAKREQSAGEDSDYGQRRRG
jgi:threonine dehydrogenase-like Zn-dependent dehydrogenase